MCLTKQRQAQLDLRDVVNATRYLFTVSQLEPWSETLPYRRRVGAGDAVAGQVDLGVRQAARRGQRLGARRADAVLAQFEMFQVLQVTRACQGLGRVVGQLVVVERQPGQSL